MSNNCFVQKVLGVSSNKFIETPTSVDLEFSQSDKNIGYFNIDTPRDNLSVLQGNIDIINSHTPKITEKTILRINDPTKVRSIEPGASIKISNTKRLLFLLMKGVCITILINHNKEDKIETIILEELFKQNITKSLNVFSFSGNDLFGNISTFASMDKMRRLEINSSNVSGDISSLANLTELTKVLLDSTNVSGDISSLANLTELTELGLRGTQVSGDISSLANLTELTVLRLSSTQVSGDISSLANLTELTVLGLMGTQVSGDITNIVINLTKLNSLSIPPTVTITDEQKKTLTDRGCTIYIV